MSERESEGGRERGSEGAMERWMASKRVSEGTRERCREEEGRRREEGWRYREREDISIHVTCNGFPKELCLQSLAAFLVYTCMYDYPTFMVVRRYLCVFTIVVFPL